MFELRPYQQECINTVLQKAKEGVRRQVIVLSTGLGKTVIFSQFPKLVKLRNKKTLIVAHREELLEQARDKLSQVSPELNIQIEQGERYANVNADVIIASIQTLGRKDSDRIKRFNPDDFGLIIIDECHRSASSSYLTLFKYFGVDKKSEIDKKVLLGVTATPSRSDNKGLDAVYDQITFSYPIMKGIRSGYLSDIKAYSVQTLTDISNVRSSGGDFNDAELGNTINNPNRNQVVVDSYLELCKNKKAIVFGADVQHVKDLCDTFKENKVDADYVIGDLPKSERRERIARFKNGELKVMVNCGVLSEGFDDPSIEAVLMARPTKSSVLYCQMIGRGIRIHESKEHLILIDFADNAGKNKIAGLPSIIGLPENAKLGPRPILFTKFEEAVKAIAEVNPSFDFGSVTDWSDKNVKKIIKQVNIFAEAELPEIVQKFSKLAWTQTIDGYRLSLPSENSDLLKETLSIKEDSIGTFSIYYETHGPTMPSYTNGYSKWALIEKREVYIKPTIESAFEAGDAWVALNKGQIYRALSQDSTWRKDPPSEKQLALLKKFKIPAPEGLSKGQASTLLGKYFEKKRRY